MPKRLTAAVAPAPAAERGMGPDGGLPRLTGCRPAVVEFL